MKTYLKVLTFYLYYHFLSRIVSYMPLFMSSQRFSMHHRMYVAYYHLLYFSFLLSVKLNKSMYCTLMPPRINCILNCLYFILLQTVNKKNFALDIQSSTILYWFNKLIEIELSGSQWGSIVYIVIGHAQVTHSWNYFLIKQSWIKTFLQ